MAALLSWREREGGIQLWAVIIIEWQDSRNKIEANYYNTTIDK